MVIKCLESETVRVSCRGCLRELDIPLAIYGAVEEARENSGGDALGKMYDVFYVSPETALIGTLGYYCDKDCYSFGMED